MVSVLVLLKVESGEIVKESARRAGDVCKKIKQRKCRAVASELVAEAQKVS
jgi:hypothetical protein